MDSAFKREEKCAGVKLLAKDPTDELYTPDSLMPVYKCLLEYMKGKDVNLWSPCDSEESAYTKYFKANQKEYGYSFRNTTDDMFTNSNCEWADIVCTNPPFSKSVDFVRNVCIPNGIDWVLMTYLASAGGILGYGKCFKTLTVPFRTQQGGVNRLPIVIVSNIDDLFSGTPKKCKEKGEWEEISISDLSKRSPDRVLYPILWEKLTNQRGLSTVFYSSKTLYACPKMVPGQFYIVPMSDLGCLPEGFKVLRDFEDKTIFCHVNDKDTGKCSYQRIIVYKEVL